MFYVINHNTIKEIYEEKDGLKYLTKSVLMSVVMHFKLK